MLEMNDVLVKKMFVKIKIATSDENPLAIVHGKGIKMVSIKNIYFENAFIIILQCFI